MQYDLNKKKRRRLKSQSDRSFARDKISPSLGTHGGGNSPA
jgi:hypothetical protein